VLAGAAGLGAAEAAPALPARSAAGDPRARRQPATLWRGSQEKEGGGMTLGQKLFAILMMLLSWTAVIIALFRIEFGDTPVVDAFFGIVNLLMLFFWGVLLILAKPEDSKP